MFCVSVSRLDSLGQILKNLDSTKLKLLSAVMCSRQHHVRRDLLCLLGMEWQSSRAAPPYKIPQCHHVSQGFSAVTTTPELGTKLKATVLKFRKTRQMTLPSETFPLNLIIKCLRASADFFSLRDYRSLLAEIGGGLTSKGVLTTMLTLQVLATELIHLVIWGTKLNSVHC